MKYFFLISCHVLTIYYCALIALIFSLEVKKLQTLDALNRLQRATMEAFHDKAPPTEVEFWKELGRADPLKDPWGQSYHLSKIGEDLAWNSSGPDKILATPDDLKKYIIVRDGVILYLENKAFEPDTGMRVMDAK